MQPVATDQRARTREALGERILDLIEQHLIALTAQLSAAARPEWLAKQSAAELAALVVAERDTTLRLLAGLRPADVSAAELSPAAALSTAGDQG